jgi:transcriptional regulator with XRE-family HTH domain
MDHISAEIRAELGRQHVSQKVLARALGWSQVKLSRRMSGRVPWAVADIESIASVLDVPRSQFLDPPVQYRRAVS